MVWISQDPVLYMLLCSANLDKLPLNLTFPSTDYNVSEPHLHQMSQYNLPYSFWEKKKQKPTKPRAAQLYFHVLTRNQFHTEQGVMSHEPQVGAHILAVLPPAVLGVQLPLQLCTSACQERAPTPLCREQSEDEWDGCTGGARRQKDLGS